MGSITEVMPQKRGALDLQTRGGLPEEEVPGGLGETQTRLGLRCKGWGWGGHRELAPSTRAAAAVSKIPEGGGRGRD